ncbi:hypothetical protein GCM10027275_26200 [Rhabdobacter roseus]
MLLLQAGTCWAQTNWKTADTTLFNANDTAKIWRRGAVAISQQHDSPNRNMLLVTARYDTLLTRGAYIAINEPRFDLEDPDSTTVGLAATPTANYQGLIVNNFANYQAGMTFPDVHTSASEFNYLRGYPDTLGFRDGGRLAKAATLKLSASFGNNGRTHTTDTFDLINLRLFTSSTANNPAEITNFYGLHLEPFRGVNAAIIKNGWGIYIAPSELKNYFSGQVGIGTTVIAHALTVSAPHDPIQVSGIQYAAAHDDALLTIDPDGVIHKREMATVQRRFATTFGDTALSDSVDLYIHKGGDAYFELPHAAERAGRSWKIINIGSGVITLSESFCVGYESRRHILNDPQQYAHELFSDGTTYVSIK